MARPDYVFQTDHHIWRHTDRADLFRSEPGNLEMMLTTDEQQVPEAVLAPALKRAVGAWVMARGGRELNLNGTRASLDPKTLDRLPDHPVRRIVSITPSNAEIVAALGFEGTDALKRLVAVDSGTDYPQEIGHLPRLGQELSINLEALAALEPDLVLASLSVPGMERNVAGLERMGIPVLVTAPRSLEDIREDVQRIGSALGLKAAAESVVEGMQVRMEALAGQARDVEPLRVLLQWWHHPIFTPTATCWSNELIELAGGVNVFRARPGQSGEVSPEAVVEANPEVIFLSWCGKSVV